MTAQLTIRADEELIERVKHASSQLGRSMNDYVTSVLDAATNPALAGTLAESIRDRLIRAGLSVPVATKRKRPVVDPKRLAAARAEAGRGTPLAQIVAEQR